MVGRVILHSRTRGCSSPNNSEWLVGLYSTQVQGAARLQTTASGWSGYTPLKYKGLLVSKQRVVGRVILHSRTRGCSSPNNSEWLVGLYSTQVQGAARLQTTASGWSGYTPLKYKGLYSTQVQGAARLQTNSEWLVGLYSTQVQGAARLQTNTLCARCAGCVSLQTNCFLCRISEFWLPLARQTPCSLWEWCRVASCLSPNKHKTQCRQNEHLIRQTLCFNWRGRVLTGQPLLLFGLLTSHPTNHRGRHEGRQASTLMTSTLPLPNNIGEQTMPI